MALVDTFSMIVKTLWTFVSGSSSRNSPSPQRRRIPGNWSPRRYRQSHSGPPWTAAPAAAGHSGQNPHKEAVMTGIWRSSCPPLYLVISKCLHITIISTHHTQRNIDDGNMDRISYFSLHSTSANNIKWPNIYTLYLNIYTHHTHNKHDMWRLLPSSKTTVSHEVETSSETIHKHKKILVLSYLNLLYLDLDSKVLHLHTHQNYNQHTTKIKIEF